MEGLFSLLGALVALSFLSVLAAFITSVFEADVVPSVLSFLSLVFVIALGATVFVSIYKCKEEKFIRETTEQVNICTDTLSIEKCKCDTTVQYILSPVYLWDGNGNQLFLHIDYRGIDKSMFNGNDKDIPK